MQSHICDANVPQSVMLRSQLRSDCYPIWLNMHSHSCEATSTPRLLNMQSRSHEATVKQSQSRSDCYPILLNMQSHSRKATVMPRDAAQLLVNIILQVTSRQRQCCTDMLHYLTSLLLAPSSGLLSLWQPLLREYLCSNQVWIMIYQLSYRDI